MANHDEREKLTPAQIQAIGLLALGESITGAAETLSLARQTVSGWLNGNPEFQAALRACQAEIFEDEVRRVKGMTARALEVIYEGLEHENYRFRLMSAVKLLSAVNIGKLIAEANKPPPPPPTIYNQYCADCGQRHEAQFFAELAEMNL
jgi:hypothetical protein